MTPPARLAPAMAAQLARVLDPGERVVWAGQPVARSFRRGGYLIAPCGLAVLGLVLYWLPRTSGAWFLALGLLTLFGLTLVAAPYLMHRTAGNTLYAITDQRALILERGERPEVRAYRLAELDKWETNRRADASGDLVLETVYFDDHESVRRMEQYGFFAIPDVRAIERILEGIKRGEDSAALLRRAWM